MFREIILPIFRSTRLCVTACGVMHPRCCRPPAVLTVLTNITSASSNSALPDDGDYTETCCSCFNVNFNTSSITVLLCISWRKKLWSLRHVSVQIFHLQVEQYAKFKTNCQWSAIFTGLFISPSGISELDCTTTKTDPAEKSISIGRESLQVFFCTRSLGVLPGSTARG